VTTLLDASALLAAINEEAGADRVSRVLGDAAMSTVNVAEVTGKLIDFGWRSAEITDLVERLQILSLPFELRDAVASAELRREVSRFGLSLGDRACLATAMRPGYRVLTAAKSWARVKLKSVRIDVVR